MSFSTRPFDNIILVGSGFLGKYFLLRLMEGYEEYLANTGKKPKTICTVIDVVEKDNIMNFPLFEKFRNKNYIDFKWSSAGDTKKLEEEKILDKADAVVYTAAIADVPFALRNPNYTWQVNYNNTMEFMRFLDKCKFKGKVIGLSSESVYGHQPAKKLPLKEDKVEPNPVNIYGHSKLAQENSFRAFPELDVTVLRSATMYGPYGRMKQAMPIFIRQIMEGKPVTLEGDGCLPADEKVFGNPHPKCIQEFEKGDRVLTKSGFGYVINTFKRDYDGNMYTIKAQGLTPFKVTDNHPVLVKRLLTKCSYCGKHVCRPNCWCFKYHNKQHNVETKEEWIPAKDVKLGDYLIIPRLKGGKPQILDLTEYCKQKARNIHDDYKLLDLNEDWCYLIGLFIADGWTTKSYRFKQKICYALGTTVKDEITLQKLKDILDKLQFKYYCRKRGNCYEISFNFTWFARWLDKNVGSKAINKRIPMILFDLPENETKSLIQGIEDGDGFIDVFDRKIASTSEILLRQLQVLLTKLGKWGSIYREKEIRGTKYNQDVCGLNIQGYIGYNNEKRTRHWIDENNIYIPVTKVDVDEFKGEVFNIETTDNTYCTPATIHNSQTRDFVYVEDTAHAIELALYSKKKTKGQIINIGSGKEIKFLNLIHLIRYTLGLKEDEIKIDFKPFRQGEEGLRVWLDISKARKLLNYEPLYPMSGVDSSALKTTIEWIANSHLNYDEKEMDALRKTLYPMRYPTPDNNKSSKDIQVSV